MKRFFLAIFSITLLSFSLSQGQADPTFQRIVELGKNDNQAMRHQDYLCNVLGGRITGSDTYVAAANWALNEFKSWGLNAELDDVGEVPVGFNRGPWFGKMIKPFEKYLEFGTPSYTAGTKGKQKGHVVVMPESDAKFDSVKNKIKGAWVLIDDENEGWPRDKDSVRTLSKKLIDAGALGTIQTTKNLVRLLDLRTVDSWGNLPKLPDIKLIDTQFDEIKKLVMKGEEVILEFDIRNFFKQGPVKYPNVIGWIPGTEFPDQYVILGAHLDSYDAGTGAIDNGSGVARMMEAIRLLTKAGVKPKRTIMIQLYAAEERGLVGSRSWVNKNKSKLQNISIMMNNDGGTNPIVAISVPNVIYDVLKPLAEPIEKLELKYPFKLSAMAKIRKAGRGGTDTYPFFMEGVPTPWLRLEGPHKYNTTWHTTLDTYDQVIPDAQEHSALVIALMAYQVANMDKLLPREGAFLPDGVFADLNTNKGRITLKLDFENVPLTVSNFVGLAEGTIKNEVTGEGKPYFNGSIWHRVVPGHVIQAGMPKQNWDPAKPSEGIEGPGYDYPNEIYYGLNHGRAGMLGMANAGPHTNGSQFYITLADRSYLDGNYTLFGYVEEGMDVVNKIAQGDTIKSVSIVRIGEKANNFQPNSDSFFRMVDEAKKKVNAEVEAKLKNEKEWIKKNLSGANELSSGLTYKIIKEGTGDQAEEGSTVKLKYSGTVLINKFDFVSDSEGKPDFAGSPKEFEFVIGKSSINPGFNEALRGMSAGEKRIVVVPYNIGYGVNSFYGKYVAGQKRFVISPNSTLYYEIEAIEVKK